jgi:hypothetical protein
MEGGKEGKGENGRGGELGGEGEGETERGREGERERALKRKGCKTRPETAQLKQGKDSEGHASDRKSADAPCQNAYGPAPAICHGHQDFGPNGRAGLLFELRCVPRPLRH